MKNKEVYKTEEIEEIYEGWIFRNYPTHEFAYGKCEEACSKMKKTFPELTIVRGLIEVERQGDFSPRRVEHWWCTLDGKIIDPTKHQFPTKILSYEAVDTTKGEPTGNCINCGKITYNMEATCSHKCDIEFLEDLDRCCLNCTKYTEVSEWKGKCSRTGKLVWFHSDCDAFDIKHKTQYIGFESEEK